MGLTALAVAFFVLPTRVHERYLYPFFALGAILAAFSWRWRITYVVFAVTTFLNMYVVLTTLYAYVGNPGIVDWLGIGPMIRTREWVSVIAIANLVAALWVFAQLREGALETLRRELSGTRLVPAFLTRAAPSPDPEPAVLEGAAATGIGASDPVASSTAASAAAFTAAAAAAPAETTLPTWTQAAPASEVGVLEWLRQKINARPLRADRSKALDSEPGGRLDRLDLWILVVLVVAILGLRMFRLAEPYQMHFDEVYHARTGTEFLQQWRYGYSHDIYEWTHPHLAKYAMAGGLVAWGDDRVSATSNLGVPVRDSIIEPRRDVPSLPGDRGGDKVHVVTGTELRSYDLQDRRLVFTAPIPGASALAYDPIGYKLYIGTDTGDILVFDGTGARRRHQPRDGRPGRAAVGVRPDRRDDRQHVREPRRAVAARRDR